MRCSQCNKFVGNEENEPEVEIEADEDGQVSGEIRIANACAECGEELTEATFQVECEAPTFPPLAQGEEVVGYDVDSDLSRDSKVEGKGRGARTFYGVSGTITVTRRVRVAGGGERADEANIEWSDYVQASHMDSLQ